MGPAPEQACHLLPSTKLVARHTHVEPRTLADDSCMCGSGRVGQCSSRSRNKQNSNPSWHLAPLNKLMSMRNYISPFLSSIPP
ncbi:hypothetical protein VTK56DRAFT_2083 [Thermocarpiscus australiensis]